MVRLKSHLYRVITYWCRGNILRDLLTHSAWLLAAQSVSAGLGFIQSVLLVRLLGAEQFGIWGIIITYTSTAYQLMSFRIGDFIVKYLTECLANKQPHRGAGVVVVAYLFTGASGLLAFSLLWFTAPIGAQWIAKSPEAAPFFQLYGLTLLAGLATDASVGTLQVFGQFRAIAILSGLRNLTTLLGIGTAFWFGAGLQEVVIAILAGTVLHGLILHALTVRQLSRQVFAGISWVPSLRLLRDNWRSMAKFLLSTNLSTSVSLLIKDSDHLWIGYFRNPAEVAYYKLAYSLTALALAPIKALVPSTYRAISRSCGQGDITALRDLLKKCSLIAASWNIPMGVGLVLVAPLVIPLLYGPEFLPAIPAIALFVLGKGVANIFYWDRPTLLAIGLPDFLIKVGLILAIAKLGSVLLVVPMLGYLGCAALLSGIYLISVFLCVRRILQYLDLEGRTSAEKLAQSSLLEQSRFRV